MRTTFKTFLPILTVCVFALIGNSAAVYAQSESIRDMLPGFENSGNGTGDSESGGEDSQNLLDIPKLELTPQKSSDLPASASSLYDPEQRREAAEAKIRDEAFKAALTGMFPLNPDEIRSLLETYDSSQQATEIPVHPYPEPEVVVETVPLDPGSKPPFIKVAKGHVTTVTTMDITGSPWPIQDISWAGNFEIVQPESGENILRITPLSEFAYGNISLRLIDLQTPVLFRIKAARDSIHYRYDARIPDYGPMAQTPIISRGTTLAAGDGIMSAILDGVPPSDAIKLEITGVDGRTSAYRINATTYVRTPMTLLSPGWSSSVSSTDGMNVYAVSSAPVLLLSDRGQVVRAALSETGESQ